MPMLLVADPSVYEAARSRPWVIRRRRPTIRRVVQALGAADAEPDALRVRTDVEAAQAAHARGRIEVVVTEAHVQVAPFDVDGVDRERGRPAQLVRPADVRLPRVGLLHPRRDHLAEQRDAAGIRLVLRRDRTDRVADAEQRAIRLADPVVLLTAKIGPWP